MAGSCVLNGAPHPLPDDPQTRLVRILADAGLADAREGCGIGRCGSCIVLLDGVPVNGCLVMAGQLAGRAVTTAAGLGARADGVRSALAQAGAVQCGYCTAGVLVSLVAALERGSGPTEPERALIGNICRCTGYAGLREAIAALFPDPDDGPPETQPGG